MNPIILDPNKVYTEEELQKNSPIPLFEDSYMGENPESLDIYIRYQNRKTSNLSYEKLEKKYVDLLPEYITAFNPKVIIDENGGVSIDIELSDQFLRAMQIKHGLKELPTKTEIIKILQKDTADFYEKFNYRKAIQSIQV